ncbi:MAG TPA: hypothetical protein VHQ01_02780, partial [Pyrinomonadaceae bacterium]|nr:hypothetical protein [Pyrinomonadaceae bacterium]
AVIWIFFMIGTMIAPNTPNNSEYLAKRELAAYMATFPASAFVAVAIGYALAAFAAGFIATKMGRRWSPGMSLALVVGALLTLGSLVVSLAWPQPLWFLLVSFLIFIPVSLVGYRLATKAV